MKSFFVALQYLLPHHLLSRLTGWFAACEKPWLKNLLIRRFIRTYRVNMDEAVLADADDYPCFNDFFTRALRSSARPLAVSPDAIVSPADGTVCAVGDINQDCLIQAKGRDFSLLALLGGVHELSAEFENGRFLTVYLSPRDYHRVHMPLAGTLREMLFVPGRLFSVNRLTSERVPNLFARNERAVCLFDTQAGPMAVILVGAMLVASIETVWAGTLTPGGRRIRRSDYSREQPPVHLQAGQEMGRFKLGSTAIVLFGPGVMEWSGSLNAGCDVRLGEQTGKIKPGH
ncbi:MAG: archaetidylserine decarboxylase [Pseudohongiellaceae bacterium]